MPYITSIERVARQEAERKVGNKLCDTTLST
jgi:hypothetical protein